MTGSRLRYLHITGYVIDLPIVQMDWTNIGWMQRKHPGIGLAVYASNIVMKN